jgi:hypothetical protein
MTSILKNNLQKPIIILALKIIYRSHKTLITLIFNEITNKQDYLQKKLLCIFSIHANKYVF